MSGEAPRALLIAASPGELWAAVCEGGELVDLRLLRTGAPGRVGGLYLGRIVGLEPGLPAAFVDIGLPRPAFLSAEDAAPGVGIGGLTEGRSVIVQVTKDARDDKAAGVTLRPRLHGRFLDLTPARRGLAAARGLGVAERERLIAVLAAVVRSEAGLLLRAEAAGVESAALVEDAAALDTRWQAILEASRHARAPAELETPAPPVAALLTEFATPAPDAILVDDRGVYAEARTWLARHHPELSARLARHAEATSLFEAAGIAAEVEGALAARVPLPGGGRLVIETTAAATMIDVDSGGAPILETNLAAARAAARQIRLRNLAGPIVIDFVAMRRRADRDRLRAVLARALAFDPAGAELLGWTRLGHMELVRKRRQAPLTDLLFERDADGGLVKTVLTVALEALRLLASETEAAPGAAFTLHASPPVAAALTEGAAQAARRMLEIRLGRPLSLVAEPARARASFEIRRR